MLIYIIISMSNKVYCMTCSTTISKSRWNQHVESSAHQSKCALEHFIKASDAPKTDCFQWLMDDEGSSKTRTHKDEKCICMICNIELKRENLKRHEESQRHRLKVVQEKALVSSDSPTTDTFDWFSQ